MNAIMEEAFEGGEHVGKGTHLHISDKKTSSV